MAPLVERPQRPRSVMVAATLLTAVAVGYLVDAVALVAGSGGYPERVRAAIAAADVDPASSRR